MYAIIPITTYLYLYYAKYVSYLMYTRFCLIKLWIAKVLQVILGLKFKHSPLAFQSYFPSKADVTYHQANFLCLKIFFEAASTTLKQVAEMYEAKVPTIYKQKMAQAVKKLVEEMKNC